MMQERDALLIVDVQNDFCPGGALPVAGGDQVVPVLNRYIGKFRTARLPIVVTRDWHPEKTTHFNTSGGVWPPHCIQGTRGAEFHPGLALPDSAIIISKGTAPDEDSYSGFQGRDAAGVGLADLLRQRSVERVFVGGLATDYCVQFTVLDGVKEGFKVVLLVDAMRGVDLRSGDSDRAMQKMIWAGAQTIVETGIPP